MTEPQSLSVLEKHELAEREQVIHAAEVASVDAGLAMGDIRDKNLYRQTHATFEQYCLERWSRSKTHANRLIDAARVITAVTPIGVIPANEAVARPLTTLRIEGPDGNMVIDMVQVGNVWQDTVERVQDNGRSRPTARDVQEMVTLWKKSDEPYKEQDSEPADVDDLAEVPSTRERTSKAEVQEEGDARRKIQEQGCAAARGALEDGIIPVSTLAMLVDLETQKQDLILSGGGEAVGEWVREQARKEARRAPEASEDDDSPGTWAEAIVGLEAATRVLVKKVSAEWSLETRSLDSLRIQQVVEDLTDVWRELEAKDEE